MKKITKAERIYEATRRECKDIITGTHGYSEGQRLSGLVTEEAVCMRTINAIMKLVDKEEHRIRLDEELGVLSGEKLQLYINVNKMVRSTVENVKKSLKKFLDDLKPNSEYSKWLDERVEAMEAQEKAEENKEYGVYAEQDEQEVQETETNETTDETETEETVEQAAEQETTIKVYFDGETEMGCYIQNAMVVLPEDYTMNQLVTAIKNAGYTRFMLPTMKRLVEVHREQEVETEATTVETSEQEATETADGISKMETTTETGDSGFEYTRSQAQEIIMAGTSIAREKYREKHGIHSPMDLKKFSKKQLDDYLSKELDYINKFLNDTLPKEVFNAMKGEIMYA